MGETADDARSAIIESLTTGYVIAREDAEELLDATRKDLIAERNRLRASMERARASLEAVHQYVTEPVGVTDLKGVAYLTGGALKMLAALDGSEVMGDDQEPEPLRRLRELGEEAANQATPSDASIGRALQRVLDADQIERIENPFEQVSGGHLGEGDGPVSRQSMSARPHDQSGDMGDD